MAAKGIKVACMAVLCIALVLAPPYAEAISCEQITSQLIPCLNYLRGTAPLPPKCCDAIKSINNSAKTTPDRQAVCGCLKDAYGRFPGVDLGKASGLPSACGVSIPYKISPSTDCSKVH